MKTIKFYRTIFFLLTLLVFIPETTLAQDPSPEHKIFLPIISRSLTNDSTDPRPLEIHSTIESIGIVSPFLKDENNNNTAAVYYRPVGSSSWQEGHALTVDRTARQWRGSLVYLNPATEYEIEVRYEDIDGIYAATAVGKVWTRPDYPQIGGTGVIRTVPTDGNLQTVINQANPGDTIQLLAGVYNESITLDASHSGEPGQYITVEPAPGAQVVFDGSDFNLNSSADNWFFYASSAQGNIYYTDLPWGNTDCNDLHPQYVGEQVQQQDVRYLFFDSQHSNWNNDFLPTPPGKAFYVCNNAGPGPQRRLYVVTFSGDDPDNHEMHVSHNRTAFSLRGTDYIRLRGFEFRYYSLTAIRLWYDANSGADNNIIENNTLHGIGSIHIFLNGSMGKKWISNNLIQNNQFYENGYRDNRWTWRTEYLHGHGGTVGIGLAYAGPGNVIRGNHLEGGHDGLMLHQQTDDVDVYDNTINECMDDGIEVDNNPGQNIRVWNNKITYCYTGISFQDWNDKSHGPVYVFRNVIVGGRDPQARTDYKGGTEGYDTYTLFKVGSTLDSKSWAYIYHNTLSLIRPFATGSGIEDGGGTYFANVVSRNNIWHVSGRVFGLNSPTTIINHNFDCDNLHDLNPNDNVFIRWSSSGGPTSNGIYRNLNDFRTYTQQEMHGLSNAQTVFNAAWELQQGSPDIDAGCFIVGFNDRGPQAYVGAAPDIGAFEFRP